MAVVEWNDAIKTVSGALTKINKKSQHAGDQKMILGTHRVAPTTSTECSRLYVRGLSSVTRSTLPSADELAKRARFASVSAAVAARAKDMTKIIPDKQAFLAQRDNADGKKTLRSYLWSLELAAYDADHPQG